MNAIIANMADKKNLGRASQKNFGSEFLLTTAAPRSTRRQHRALRCRWYVMAQWGIGTIRIPSPHRGGSRGPVRLLAIGQPPGPPALPEQGPLPRVPPRGGRHPPDGRIMHPTGASRSLPRSAGLCRRASEPIRRER
jgi:hypothetical protein